MGCCVTYTPAVVGCSPVRMALRQAGQAKLNNSCSNKTCVEGRGQFWSLLCHLPAMRWYAYTILIHISSWALPLGNHPKCLHTGNSPQALWFGLSIPSPPSSLPWDLCQIFITRMFSFSVRIVQPCSCKQPSYYHKAYLIYLEAKEKKRCWGDFEPLS